MKKLLSILATQTLLTSVSTAVVSCNDTNSGIVDDNKGTTENPDLAKNRSRFISELEQITSNFFSSYEVQNSLMQLNSQFDNYQFLSNESLMKLSYEDNISTLTLNDTQIKALLTDIKSLINISSGGSNSITSLESQVNSLASKEEYIFMFPGGILPFKDINFNDNILTVTRVATTPTNGETGDDVEYSYNLKFGVSINYTFSFNNEVENLKTSSSSIIINSISNEKILSDLNKLVSDLPQKIYESSAFEKYTKYNEEDLGITKPYENPSSSVVDSMQSQKNSFLTAVNSLIGSELGLSGLSVSFDILSATRLNSLYSLSKTITSGKNSFIDQAILLKDKQEESNKTSAQLLKEAMGDSLMNDSSSAFLAKANSEIKSNTGIEIDSNTAGFEQYGYISFDNFTVSISGVDFVLNPIQSLYLYTSTEGQDGFVQSVVSAISKWQEVWGITKSQQDYALYSISETTIAGKTFWKYVDKYKNWPFAGVNANTDKTEMNEVYGKIQSQTNFSSFILGSDTNGVVQSTNISSGGYSIAYSGNSSTPLWTNWIYFGEDFKITLKFDVRFQKNLFVGKLEDNSTAYVFEKH